MNIMFCSIMTCTSGPRRNHQKDQESGGFPYSNLITSTIGASILWVIAFLRSFIALVELFAIWVLSLCLSFAVESLTRASHQMGWFGFNAGSALTSGSDAVHALFNTHIAACASTVAFVAVHKMIYKKHLSAIAMLNGAVRRKQFFFSFPFPPYLTTFLFR